MAIVVRIFPSKELYLRDPQSTDLGNLLLKCAISELNDLGLESFTFKKLAIAANCTEATVYRYWQSKYQLLQYLVAYYWDWVHHLVNQAVAKENTAVARLRSAILALTEPMTPNPGIPYIDERLLHSVVLTEGTKAYHLKLVDAMNTKGLFSGYKLLTEDIANLITDVNPDFPYPRALATNLFEIAHNHTYFAEHLPRLTDLKHGEKTKEDLQQMLMFWVDGLVCN